jgi:hypothetical protein
MLRLSMHRTDSRNKSFAMHRFAIACLVVASLPGMPPHAADRNRGDQGRLTRKSRRSDRHS